MNVRKDSNEGRGGGGYHHPNQNNMQKLALILTVVVGLITTAIESQAGLGWTMTKCKQEYGRPIIGPKTDLAGRKKYQFEIKGYAITAFFLEGKVSRISYHKNSDITAQDLPTLLTMGAPNPIWGHAYQDPADKEGAWHWVDNSNSLFASLVDSNTVLIWTKTDIDTLRAAIKSERM